MRHLSIHDLQGDTHRRWADARKGMYRQILRDPSVSDHQKETARRKLAEIDAPRRR